MGSSAASARLMATSSSQSQTARTACDRCYELKERCTRASASTICTRCKRLGLICKAVRPVRRAGRRPHQRENVTGRIISPSQSSSISNPSVDIGTWLMDTTGLSLEEKELLIFFLTKPENMEHYPVSLSFRAAEQQSLAAALPAAFTTLKHAYLAFAGALKSLQLGIVTEAEKSASIFYAASAMKTLRSLPVTSSEDASLCLTLGASLALFVYSAVGAGVADICHYCLSATAPFTETVESESDSHLDTKPWQSVLVLLETMECLMYRRKPTLRIQLQVPQNIDRHLGLCLPLMPYYYDICDVSHSMVGVTDPSYLIYLQRRLEEIHAAIQSWQPSQPSGLVDQTETVEVVHLLAQARVYRLAGLLVCHRLRHGFGEQDSQAGIWSKEIMMELELTRLITKQPVRCVTLPFIVAAVEIQDSTSRIKTLQHVDEYVDHFTPVIQRATRTFLSRIWHERDVQMTTCWFDSINKPCAVLHSIDASCFPLAN